MTIGALAASVLALASPCPDGVAGAAAASPLVVASPSGKVAVTFSLDQGVNTHIRNCKGGSP